MGVRSGSLLYVTSAARGVVQTSSSSFSESKSDVTSRSSPRRRSRSLHWLRVSEADEHEWMRESSEGDGYFMCRYSLPNDVTLRAPAASPCGHLSAALCDVTRSELCASSCEAIEEAVVCQESLESL